MTGREKITKVSHPPKGIMPTTSAEDPDPIPQDPYVIRPPGSGSFLSSSKKCYKKTYKKEEKEKHLQILFIL